MDLSHVVEDSSVAWISELWEGNTANSVYGFVKIPMDYAVSYRPGTRFGPERILTILNSYSAFCADKNVSFAHAKFMDLGCVSVVHDLQETYQNIQSLAQGIPSHVMPIFLGGDHSIADPIFRGLRHIHPDKKIGVIVFDAHFDSREPTHGKEHSGHWVYTLSDVIDYRLLTQIGINAPVYSSFYMDKAQANGVKIYSPYRVRKKSWDTTIQEMVAFYQAHCDGVYISIDIDCIDQAFAPGTSVPNPCGLWPNEVCDAVYELCAQLTVLGLDVNEVSPPLDDNDRTSHLAAHIICNAIAGCEVRRHQVTQKVSG